MELDFISDSDGRKLVLTTEDGEEYETRHTTYQRETEDDLREVSEYYPHSEFPDAVTEEIERVNEALDRGENPEEYEPLPDFEEVTEDENNRSPEDEPEETLEE